MRFDNLGLSVLCGLILSTQPSQAQAPPPNADIVKMLVAGVPESVIVNKIHQGSGRWDTSVDAIIALKKAGATEGELAALTATVAPPQPEAPKAPLQVLGGIVRNQYGTVTFSLPSSQRAGALVLNFEVVALGDHLGLKLSTEGVLERGTADYREQFALSYGDLIFERGRIRYYPYIDAGSTYGNSFPIWTASAVTQPVDFEPSVLSPVYLKRIIHDVNPVSEDYASVGPGLFNYRDLWQITNLQPTKPSKVAPQWGFRLGDAYDQSIESANAHETLDLILHKADSAIGQILTVAGSSSASVLSDARSAYAPASPALLANVISARNATIAQRQQDYKATRSKAQLIESNGGNGTSGFLTFLNVMQGVTNMAQAQSQANVAAANHDMAGQLNAAMNAGKAEAQTLNAISNPNATSIQPIAPTDPNAIQNAKNQQLANIQAAQARAQATQAQKPTQTAQAQSGFRYNVASPAPSAPVANSGTAPPPTCVYLSPGNCMPLAQYQQLQGAESAGRWTRHPLSSLRLHPRRHDPPLP